MEDSVETVQGHGCALARVTCHMSQWSIIERTSQDLITFLGGRSL